MLASGKRARIDPEAFRRSMRRVLVLRPEPGATATVRRAERLGLDAIALPLFEIEPIAWKAPDPAGFDALLLSSANGVRYGGEQLQKLRGLSVRAVGEATAEAARDAGFDVASCGDAGIGELLDSTPANFRLVHLCGEHRKALTGVRQQITPVPVYRAVAIAEPEMPDCAGTVVLIHSPRAGQRYAQLIEERSDITIAAISPAAAEAVGTGWEMVQTADRPNDDALLALATRLCNKPARP